MTAVWEQRFAAFVRRLTALRESSSLELLPDLMPVLSVLNPDEAELHLLRGERICWGRDTAIAVAARFSFVELLNPVTNVNLLAVVDELRVSSSQLCRLVVSPVSYGAAASTSPCFTDGRGLRWSAGSSFTTKPTCIVNFGDAAALGASDIGDDTHVAPTNFTTDPRAVLLPGMCVRVISTVANASVTVSYKWRERAANRDELESFPA